MIIMNSSNCTESNASHVIQTLIVVKACLYLLNFIFITAMSILIIRTVRKNTPMKKEVRYFLLCHHLLYSSVFCCLGTVFSALQAFKVKNRWLWILFGMQMALGETVLITLTLMALNTCLAVCWPLRYLAFVHFVKHKVMACVWIGAMLKSTCLLVIEGIRHIELEDMFEAEFSCPLTQGGNFAKIAGFVLMTLLSATIIISYCFLCREGNLTGHFNCSNRKAQKTIAIHGLQMSLHILPPLIITAIGKGPEHIEVKFGAFVIFLFAQSFSPVVYGLRNKELRNKISFRQGNQ